MSKDLTLGRVSFRLNPDKDPRDKRIHTHLVRLIGEGKNLTAIVKDLIDIAIILQNEEQGHEKSS